MSAPSEPRVEEIIEGWGAEPCPHWPDHVRAHCIYCERERDEEIRLGA